MASLVQIQRELLAIRAGRFHHGMHLGDALMRQPGREGLKPCRRVFERLTFPRIEW
jgi:hypothetical protein